MIATMQPMALDLQLPWSDDPRQEQTFRRLLKLVLVPLLILILVIPWLPVFELSFVNDREQAVMTTVMLEPLEEPVPPPPPEEPAQPERAKPVVAATEPEQPKPAPKKASARGEKVKQDSPNAMAQSQGLNELSSQLTALRGTLDLARLQNRNVSSSTQGSAKQNTREYLGRDGAVKRSDGIEVDDAMLAGDTAGLADYTSTQVDGLGLGDAPVSTLASHSSYKNGQRDMESIRRTLERTKSSVNSIYQKALMDNPELAGKFTFKLVIEPDGRISNLKLLVSELGMADVEREILAKIQRVNFGAKEVSPAVVEYKFVFLPS